MNSNSILPAQASVMSSRPLITNHLLDFFPGTSPDHVQTDFTSHPVLGPGLRMAPLALPHIYGLRNLLDSIFYNCLKFVLSSLSLDHSPLSILGLCNSLLTGSPHFTQPCPFCRDSTPHPEFPSKHSNLTTSFPCLKTFNVSPLPSKPDTALACVLSG